jgi:hypothetical protein
MDSIGGDGVYKCDPCNFERNEIHATVFLK